jgi:hypothetical protein
VDARLHPRSRARAGLDLQTIEPSWLSGYALAAASDVLLHDAQYSEEEYPAHIGWGHSSIEHVVSFAKRSGAHQLVMFHHDPRHTDAVLDGLCDRACTLWGPAGNLPVAAYEGMTLGVANLSTRS